MKWGWEYEGRREWILMMVCMLEIYDVGDMDLDGVGKRRGKEY